MGTNRRGKRGLEQQAEPGVSSALFVTVVAAPRATAPGVRGVTGPTIVKFGPNKGLPINTET